MLDHFPQKISARECASFDLFCITVFVAKGDIAILVADDGRFTDDSAIQIPRKIL